jgi:hypothetical protein
MAATFALCAAGGAYADCIHNGETVPEGTRIGGYVCVNGEWVDG